MTDTKTCFRCKETKGAGEFYASKQNRDGLHSWCKPCTRAIKAESRAKNPVSVEKRREYVSRWKNKNPDSARAHYRRMGLKKFGMTEQDYRDLHESQDGLCAICGQAETALTNQGDIKPLSVDHDHETGRVRGLLCSRCNTAIGLMSDDIERLNSAISYLRGTS